MDFLSEKQPFVLKCIDSINLHQPLKATCFQITVRNVKNICCIAYVKISSHFQQPFKQKSFILGRC